MYYYGGRLIKKEIFENDKIAERHEYEYSGYQGPKDKEYYYVAISRPYKTRVCNLEEYSYPKDTYDLVISNLVLHYIEKSADGERQ